MIRRLLAAATMTLLLMTLPGASPQAQTLDTSLQTIRTSVVQALGVEASTVRISIAGNILLVERTDQALNRAGHGARDAEASRIAPVVSKVLAAKPGLKKIHTIRVLYVLKAGGSTKNVDTVDFRKDPSGAFTLHTT